MIPQAVKSWLGECYSEREVRALVGGTRQNWSQRKGRIRRVAGIEILPGTWVYRRDAIDAAIGMTPR
jgi:hypothetical protein